MSFMRGITLNSRGDIDVNKLAIREHRTFVPGMLVKLIDKETAASLGITSLWPNIDGGWAIYSSLVGLTARVAHLSYCSRGTVISSPPSESEVLLLTPQGIGWIATTLLDIISVSDR